MGLATVVVGDEYSSLAYERRLCRLAGELGVPYTAHHRPATVTQDDLIALVGELNVNPAVSGVLLLRPLGDHIDEPAVFRAIDPHKDVEAVHPENAGLLALGAPRFVPSTAASVFFLLDRWLDSVGEDQAAFYHRSLIVVVGRSNNVGKPAISLGYERQESGLAGLARDYGIDVADPTDEVADVDGSSSDDDPADTDPVEIAEALIVDLDIAASSENSAGVVELPPSVGTDEVTTAIVTIESIPTESGTGGSVARRPGASRARPGVRTRKRRATAATLPPLTLAVDPSWQPARLFSVTGVGNKYGVGRSAPYTPRSPSRLRFQALHRFHGLHRETPGSALPQ